MASKSGANKKVSSPSNKEHYKSYERERRWLKNKKAALNRHLKKYPEDATAKKARERCDTLSTPAGPKRGSGHICKMPPALKVFPTERPKTIAEQLHALGLV